jgi:hypothetical protein
MIGADWDGYGKRGRVARDHILACYNCKRRPPRLT